MPRAAYHLDFCDKMLCSVVDKSTLLIGTCSFSHQLSHCTSTLSWHEAAVHRATPWWSLRRTRTSKRQWNDIVRWWASVTVSHWLLLKSLFECRVISFLEFLETWKCQERPKIREKSGNLCIRGNFDCGSSAK